jgi:hypothetical protein
MVFPPKVQEQYDDLIHYNRSLSREECERRYPDLINFIRENVSLVALIESYNIKLKPVSPDRPDILVAVRGCPSCHSTIFVKRGDYD